MQHLKPARALLPLALALGACGEEAPSPLDARTAALTADANFRRVAVELADAAAFLAESRTFGGLAACDEAPALAEPCEPLDPEATATALADFLSTRIFTQANVEAESGTSVTFRLRPEVVCDAGDAACADLLAELPVRLQVTSDEPGDLDVAVLVGEPAVHPLDIGLHQDELEVQADLAAIRALLLQLGAPAEELPAVMEGRVALGIARHAAGDFTASLSVLERVAVHSALGGPWQFELAAALPAAAARIDAASRQISVRLGLAALSLRGPLEFFFGEEEAACDLPDCSTFAVAPPEGTVGLHLAGLTGETVFESLGGDVDVLRFRSIGLGNDTSVLDMDGAPILTVDLNPLAGRAFDLVATADDHGTELQFAPSFDLGLGFYFANAADQIEVPDWALEEMLHIRVDGAAAPRIRLIEEASAAEGTQRVLAQVLDGALTLASDSLATVQVEAGMCLLSLPVDETMPEHPFTGLEAGSCVQ